MFILFFADMPAGGNAYVCVYMFMRICTSMRMSMRLCVRAQVHVLMHAPACVCVCVCKFCPRGTLMALAERLLRTSKHTSF